MNEIFKKNKTVFVFLIKMALFYLIWTVIYTAFLKPNKIIDQPIITNLILVSERSLNILGYETFSSANMVGIKNTSGLIISPVCDGLDLFALFSIFILSFPGRVIAKFWFVISGVIIIHSLNIFRIILLAVIELKSPSSLEFNHSYTFTLTMYLIIFSMWMWWVKRSSRFEVRSGGSRFEVRSSK